MNSQLLNELLQFNMKTYDEMPQELYGWRRLHKYFDQESGMECWAYGKGDQMLMVVKGTEMSEKEDRDADFELAKGKFPKQLNEARYFRKAILKKFPSYKKLNLTGYSLGASLVMAIGAVTGEDTYCFSPFGIKDILGSAIKHTSNIVNYGYYKDPIYNSNRDNMIGKVYLTGKTNEKIEVQSLQPLSLPTHFPEFVYDLNNTIEYQPKEHLTVKDKLLNGNYSIFNRLTGKQKVSILADLTQDAADEPLKGGIEKSRVAFAKTENTFDTFKANAELALRPGKRFEERLKKEWAEAEDKLKNSKFNLTKAVSGYKNHFLNSDRIFSREEIGKLPYKAQKKYKEAIEYQRKTIGIPSKTEIKEAVKSGGVVHVSAYIRADGVRVEAYYRARPSR